MTNWDISHLRPTHLRAGRWEEHGDCQRPDCPCYRRGVEDEREAAYQRDATRVERNLTLGFWIFAGLLAAAVLLWGSQ